MIVEGNRGIGWVGHFGFMIGLLILLQPVLSWATAKMWPLWQDRGGWIAVCMMFGLLIIYVAQTKWSMDAGSSDAWSTDGRPNEVGILHIVHGTPEIAIMLMLAVSALWFREMPWLMFFGILALVLAHFYIGGTHRILRWGGIRFGNRKTWTRSQTGRRCRTS
jgi:hypothetical protein